VKLIELMVAFVGLPEQYAEIESILVLVGLGLAVVLGSLFNNLIVQPGFVLFLDRVRSVLSELGLTKKQDAKLSALEKRDKAQTKRLDDLDAKMDNVLAVLDTNNTLIQANSKAISALGDSQIQLDDDLHTVMDMIDGHTTSEIARRRDRRRREREMKVLEGGREAAEEPGG